MADIKISDDIFFTKSMAELLEGQGKFEDALTVYSILFKSCDASLSSYYSTKIEELKQRASTMKSTKK